MTSRRVLPLLLVSTLGLFIAVPFANAQFSQQAKVVGTGGVRVPNQGWSASISGDGNTAILGGAFDNTNAGAAWVFTRTGSTWSQEGNKLVGTGAVGNATQGISVAIAADGNTAIV